MCAACARDQRDIDLVWFWFGIFRARFCPFRFVLLAMATAACVWNDSPHWLHPYERWEELVRLHYANNKLRNAFGFEFQRQQTFYSMFVFRVRRGTHIAVICMQFFSYLCGPRWWCSAASLVVVWIPFGLPERSRRARSVLTAAMEKQPFKSNRIVHVWINKSCRTTISIGAERKKTNTFYRTSCGRNRIQRQNKKKMMMMTKKNELKRIQMLAKLTPHGVTFCNSQTMRHLNTSVHWARW